MCVVEVKQSVAHRVAERVVDRAATFVPDSALVKGDGIRVNGGGGAAREESAEDEEEREGERSEESGSDGEEKIEGFHIFFFYLQYRFLVCEWNGCVLLDAFLALVVSYW